MDTIAELTNKLKQIKIKLIQDCESAGEQINLPNVTKLSKKCAIVNSTELLNNWSAKTYIAQTQIDRIIELMESGTKVQELKEIVEFASGIKKNLPDYHIAVAQTLAPYIKDYIELYTSINTILPEPTTNEWQP